MTVPLEQARLIVEAEVKSLTEKLEGLDSERNIALGKLQKAQRALCGLDEDYDPIRKIKNIAIRPKQFSGKKIANCIAECLELATTDLTVGDLVPMLNAGDAKLGRTPQRTVSVAVTTNHSKLIAWRVKRQSLVCLIRSLPQTPRLACRQ